MKSTFEQMGGTYRQEGDYLLPNLALPDEPDHQIGKYGLLRRSFLKNHRSGFYTDIDGESHFFTNIDDRNAFADANPY